jgi:PAS domain S-box-containing protein
MSTSFHTLNTRQSHRNSYFAPWHAINIDHQGIITFANILAADCMQQPAATLIGQPLTNFITTADLPLPLIDTILATRTNETHYETTCQLTCNDVTAYYDIFARYIVDSDIYIFMFTPHIHDTNAFHVNAAVQYFVNETLTESSIDVVFASLQKALASVNVGVFCLLLQQPVNITPQLPTATMDFTGLWVFGHRIPTEMFASLNELNAFLTSQSNSTTAVHLDPVEFGELPSQLNELLAKRFMASGLRAYVTIPLQSNGQIIGIIGLFSPFKDWIEAIAPSTLSNIHMVIAQLYARNHLQSQITRLQRLNHEINTITNITINHEFFASVCQAAQRIFDATHVLIARHVPDTNELIITDTDGMQVDSMPITLIDTQILSTPRRHINRNPFTSPLFAHINEYIQTEVMISVPLQRNNTLFGVLLIMHDQHEFLTQQDVTYAAQFAEFVTSHYHQQQLTNALNESERRYRFLINESSNPIIVVNINDVVIHMNHAARRLIGVDSIDVLLFESFFPSRLQSEWQEKRQLLGTGERPKLTWQSEIINQIKEQQVPVEIEAQIITHDRNTPEILISMRDMRLQRESERRQTLREQELAMFQHITSIVNSSLDLNVLLERSLDIFDEIQFGHMLGIILINENNIPFVAAHRHVPPELIAQVVNSPNIIRGAVDMVLSNYDSQMSIYNTSQESILTSDLIKSFGNMIGAALSDNGKHIGIILTSRPFVGSTPFTPRDIQILHTVANQLSRAITNARLHQSLQIAAERYINLYEDTEEIRSHLSSIIENSPDILILCNRNTLSMNILNTRPMIILGYDPNQLQNLSIMTLCHADNQEQFALHLERINAQASYNFEFSLVRGDKQAFTALISSSIVNKHDILVVIKDITPMRQLENRIKQREKLASLGQMIAGVAHELNNPIAVIRGITQLQLMQAHEEQLQKDLQTIDQTSQRAGRILKQLRSLAQPQMSQHVAVDIVKLVQHITSQYQVIFADAGITCTVHAHPSESYIISGQDAQIEQVFVNLLDNAIHAMRNINTVRELNISFIAAPRIITIFVDDTGSGIDKSARDYIFDPFYTTRKIGEGLGLGLAIVHTIIQQHHGTIMYQNRQTGGTRFIIEIPTLDAPRIRVAQKTMVTDLYMNICSKIRELTTTPLVEVESIVDRHDLLIIDEQLLASFQDIPAHTVICVISRTTATMPLHQQHRVIRISPQMNELQLTQQMQVLVSLLNQANSNKE